MNGSHLYNSHQYGMGVNADGKMTDVNIGGLSKEQAAQIDKGKPMKFRCTSLQEIMGGVHLDECVIS